MSFDAAGIAIEERNYMKLNTVMMILLLCFFSFHPVPAFAVEAATPSAPAPEKSVAGEQDMVTLKAPIFSPFFSSAPLASVNDELITFEDVKVSIGSMHADVKEVKTKVRRDYAALLNRLINVKLILQEAKNIGLDELPEIEQEVKSYEQRALIEFLQKQVTKDVKLDDGEVEKVYREMVKELKLKSVLFAKEEDAREVESKIKGGGSFDDLITKALADGIATGEKDASYFKIKDMLPQVAQIAGNMTIGSISPVIPVPAGFALFKVEDIRYPDNPGQREQAKMQVLYSQQVIALSQYNHTLTTKYVTLNRAVYNSVNYEKVKLAVLRKDKRAIVKIKGDKPITVGDLTEALENKLYHGAGSERGGKRLNEKKRAVLEELIAKRLLRMEALRQGIDRSEAFKNDIKEYRNSLLFNEFVQKVVVPDIKLSAEELKSYYDSHAKEYRFPEMMRIKSIAFFKKEHAENAREKILKGTDFQWLSENAEGRIDKTTVDPLTIGTGVVVVSDLPEDIRKAVEGARVEDARLYHPRGGFYYVLYIPELIPSKPQPYEAVKEEIAKKIFNEKLNKAVEEYVQKLRQASDITIYATGFTN